MDHACPICGVPANNAMRAVVAPFLRERCDIPAHIAASSRLCGECEHVFFMPFLGEEAVRRLYDGYRNEAYTSQRVRWEPEYEAVARELSDEEGRYFQVRRALYDEFHADRFGLRGLVVDAGDGQGYFGRYAYPHADVVILPRFGELPGVTPPDLLRAADVLMMTHILQQSPRPAQMLSCLTQWLRPDAEVWIEVPIHYSGSLRASFETQKALTARGAGPLGPLATLHETLSHYSVNSLRRLCGRAGLVPQEFVRSGAGILGVLARRSTDPVDPSGSSTASGAS